MKNIFILFTVLLLSTTAHADYNGNHIQFEMETTKGEIIIGYTNVFNSYLNTDSLQNTDYLNNSIDLIMEDWDKKDSLFYFKERVRYEYINVGDDLNERKTIYTFINSKAIATKEIKSISLIEILNYSYSTDISNPISLSDSIWMNKKALSSFSFANSFEKLFICN